MKQKKHHENVVKILNQALLHCQQRELQQAETALPSDFRDMYQRVIKAKGQDAMAVVEGGSCGGCYQQLTINVVNEINMGRVVLCKSCGRVLYLPEDTRPK